MNGPVVRSWATEALTSLGLTHRSAQYLADSGIAKVRVGVSREKSGLLPRVSRQQPEGGRMVGYFFAQAVHQPLPFTALPPKRSQGALAASAAPLK